MSKELRIEVVVELPDDLFDQGAAIAKAGMPYKAFAKELAAAVKPAKIKVDMAVVTPKPHQRRNAQQPALPGTTEGDTTNAN